MLSGLKHFFGVPSEPEQTVAFPLTKIISNWIAVLIGFTVGELAALAALIYTSLNIIFLLYDRFKSKRSTKRISSKGDKS